MVIWLLASCTPHLTSPPGGDDTAAWEAPVNGWPVTPPPADLEGEGFAEGQVVPDFRLMDQNGDTVALWQFYGQIIALDISTMWCSPCQQLADEGEETYTDYRDQGFMYVTVLPEDIEGQPTELDDLTTWTGYYGLTSVVAADPDKAYTAPAVPDGQYPVVLVVDRTMRVVTDVEVTPEIDTTLRAAIEAAL
jgi:peroxiredoxin